jgi:hypothetical protein
MFSEPDSSESPEPHAVSNSVAAIDADTTRTRRRPNLWVLLIAVHFLPEGGS